MTTTIEDEFLNLLRSKDDAGALALLAKGPFTVRGWPPITTAALNGRDVVVFAMLDQMNAKQQTKMLVPLAGNAQSVKLLDRLLALGLDPNAVSDGSPLITTYALRAPAMTARMIAAGADVNAPARYGKTALYTASYHCRPEVVKLLLGAPGIRVDVKEDNGVTPLVTALGKLIPRRVELIQMLLAAGAKVTDHVLAVAETRGIKAEFQKLVANTSPKQEPSARATKTPSSKTTKSKPKAKATSR